MKKFCPCGSEKQYEKCCKPYHMGKKPENALILMKSRYSAYFFHMADYIINTTDSKNINFQKDKKKWKKEILFFCKNTKFEKLEILDFKEEKNRAYVVFKASLSQNNKDVSFTEKSYFEKNNSRWLYTNREILK